MFINAGDFLLLASLYKTNTGTTDQSVVLDTYGNTLSSKDLPAACWNFEKWEVDGKVRYTYVEANVQACHIAPASITPGVI